MLVDSAMNLFNLGYTLVAWLVTFIFFLFLAACACSVAYMAVMTLLEVTEKADRVREKEMKRGLAAKTEKERQQQKEKDMENLKEKEKGNRLQVKPHAEEGKEGRVGDIWGDEEDDDFAIDERGPKESVLGLDEEPKKTK